MICLSQQCTRNYLSNVDPQSTNNSVNNLQICLDISEPTLHKEITSAILAHMAERQCLWGKTPIKCCIDPSETLHKKTTCTVLTQSAQTCFRRKTGCSFKWLVACFLAGYNILNNLGSFCSMSARLFIYDFWDNNEQDRHWLKHRRKRLFEKQTFSVSVNYNF